MTVPVIDIAPLVSGTGDVDGVARAIDAACRDHGFFSVVGHGVDPALQARLDATCRAFFALPEEEKAQIAMAHAGVAWRGWFPVGGELTSGVPDRKEGIYFGAELGPGHPKVVAGVPLHGANLFPRHPEGLRAAVLDTMAALTDVGQTVLTGMALGLGLAPSWFRDTLTADPVTLFRVFHYPPAPPDDEGWGVGEHTDYGLLTLLGQDEHGGLQVRGRDGGWMDVAPVPGAYVCNLGDMLERLTDGRYRSTPHRVRNTSGAGRLSFPFFLDPGWDVVVPGADGPYGDYLLAKVSKVFPTLAP